MEPKEECDVEMKLLQLPACGQQSEDIGSETESWGPLFEGWTVSSGKTGQRGRRNVRRGRAAGRQSEGEFQEGGTGPQHPKLPSGQVGGG